MTLAASHDASAPQGAYFDKTLGEFLLPYEVVRTLPIPATFVVGRDGMVKARFVNPDFRRRMAIEDLLAALKDAR
jgi:hypothetical protein